MTRADWVTDVVVVGSVTLTRTGSSHSGVEEYPEEKAKLTRIGTRTYRMAGGCRKRSLRSCKTQVLRGGTFIAARSSD